MNKNNIEAQIKVLVHKAKTNKTANKYAIANKIKNLS